MTPRLPHPLARLAFVAVLFAALLAAIVTRPDKRLTDFDQSFYLTIAYDLVHHGTFSNGIFDKVDSTRAVPQPGMFFAPLYPLVVAAAAKLDPHFKTVLDCTIEANENHRDLGSCEIYARPLHVAHAAFITLGVVAIALAAELIFGGVAVFYLAGALAALGIGLEADLLSFVMTESLSFGVFSLFGYALIAALVSGRWQVWALAGLAAGLAALARPPYMLMIPLGVVLLAVATRWPATLRAPSLRGGRQPDEAIQKPSEESWIASAAAQPRNDGEGSSRRLARFCACALAFLVCASLLLAPWLIRNKLSLGKLGFTEEYGAVTLIERFAFNTMTAREFGVAFLYCVPAIGPPAIDALLGEDARRRFQWNSPGSFFELGRGRREALLAAHGKLDPILGEVMRAEMADGGVWRHLMSSVALSYCGLWVAGVWSLVLLPLFAVACVIAIRRRRFRLIYYAAPALLLVGLHGVMANHYPRYNLGLIGPIAAGAAFVMVASYTATLRRRRSGGNGA